MTTTSTSQPRSLEAKIVILGSQGVGKTSLVHRIVKHTFLPTNKAQSTVGASFLTTRVQVDDTTLRLQIWDTAGQERFRSISRLYYRGAHAAILCYDVTDNRSFEELAFWLKEIRDHAGSETIVQIVGTKADVAVGEPEKRQVAFEKCLDYVAENLNRETSTAGPGVVGSWGSSKASTVGGGNTVPVSTPAPMSRSNRSSGLWGQDAVWDCAHEVSAKDGEGVDEVFRVVTRKLVEQNARKIEHVKFFEGLQARGKTPGGEGEDGYFDLPKNGNGSFRVGYGDRRRSWLGLPLTPGGLITPGVKSDVEIEVANGMKKGRCC